MIPRLLTGTGEVSEPQELRDHIYGFYLGLMGLRERRGNFLSLRTSGRCGNVFSRRRMTH
jgi:hypothetical protein